MRHSYTLFKRYKDPKSKKGVIWYFSYYDETRRRRIKSTGKNRKYEAELFAEEYLDSLDQSQKTLEEYSKTFFVWEECLWIKRQHAKGKRFSKGIAHLRRSHLTGYILPKFGRRPLTSLNRVEIENWLVDLHGLKTGEQLSNQTKNHILFAFRIVMREAEREGLIPLNCLRLVEPLANHAKVRDIFTKEELQMLFPIDLTELIRIWGKEEYAYYFYILATTGMRRGEARGLQWRHVIKKEERYGLLIEQAVRNDDTLGSTKTGKSRVVLLSKRAQEYLNTWYEATPYKESDSFVFFGREGNRPIMGKTLQSRFTRALRVARIKVNGRNLVIHSFRHTYNTLLRSVLPIDILQSTTGHTSNAMTEHYNHPTTEDRYMRILKYGQAFDGLV